jgi:hypothetical protein
MKVPHPEIKRETTTELDKLNKNTTGDDPTLP